MREVLSIYSELSMSLGDIRNIILFGMIPASKNGLVAERKDINNRKSN